MPECGVKIESNPTSGTQAVAANEVDMAYALMILEPAGQRQSRTPEEGRDLYERMLQFSGELKSRGVLTMTASLTSDAHGARVRVRSGQPTVLDGPFAETKEMIGGFFILTCETRDDAIAIAKQCPAAKWGTVEVRELGPCFN